MARIRTIKPEFFLNEEMASLSAYHRLCFIGLLTQADKAGRLEDRPKRLRAVLFPFEDIDVDQLLTDLHKAHFVIRYEVKNVRYIQIRTFLKHQRPHHTEKESEIPECLCGIIRRKRRLSNGDLTCKEGKGKEGKGKEGKGVGVSSPNGDSTDLHIDPKISLWLQKTRHLGSLSDDRNVDLWSGLERAYDSYPWLYFEEEINKADAWISANPGRAPTPKGLPRFMRNWLERAVEIGRRRRAEVQVARR